MDIEPTPTTEEQPRQISAWLTLERRQKLLMLVFKAAHDSGLTHRPTQSEVLSRLIDAAYERLVAEPVESRNERALQAILKAREQAPAEG